MGRYVALLRGINVGGRHKIAMRDLKGWFEDAGCREVESYIQSGNVVFEASAALARNVPATLGERIRSELGFDAPLVVRSAREWNALVEANPYLGSCDPAAIAVGLVASKPTKARLARLDPDRGLPDRYEVNGREIYLCLPGGAARSKLTNAYFDRQLETVVTVRNWRTVLELQELL